MELEQRGGVDLRLREGHRGDPDSLCINGTVTSSHVAFRSDLRAEHRANVTFEPGQKLLSLMVVYGERDVPRLLPLSKLKSDIYVQWKSPDGRDSEQQQERDDQAASEDF